MFIFVRQQFYTLRLCSVFLKSVYIIRTFLRPYFKRVSGLWRNASADEEIVQAARVNTIENFKFIWDQTLEGLFINRMDQNQEIFAKFMNDAAFRTEISRILMKQVYHGIREQASSL